MTLGSSTLSRRSWLLGAGLGLFVPRLAVADNAEALKLIRERGKKAGMEGFDEQESPHFVGIGDAGKAFRKEALAICETVGAEYLKHFAARKFEVAWPKEKLVVVILQGPKSYVEFEGGFLDEAVGGHFDLGRNWLVMFDARGSGANPKEPIDPTNNTLTLVHELTHQLTFNTGLLDLKADVPVAISEGLATYGETWGPKGRMAFGAENKRRLAGLKQGIAEGVEWIPLKALLADDKLFDPECKAVQVAYAEAWLLAHKLMSGPMLAKARAYLAALREKPDKARRLEVAAEHLGDLDKLDREIRSGK